MKNISISPDALIQKRNYAIANKKSLWKIIAENNVLKTTSRIKFDLAKIYEEIKTTEKELVLIKFATQAANFGFNSLKSIPENNSVKTIFRLCEVSERIVKLGLVPIEAKTDETVFFNKIFIDYEIEELAKEKKDLEAKLTEFNKTKLFDFSPEV